MLAQEESRLLDHNYIGTEHLLLGLIHESEGVAAKSLDALGVTLDKVRAAVSERVGTGSGAPSGHIPFTPRAKKVLEMALRESLQLGHNYVGTEHLLLGLLREGEGQAIQILVTLEVPPTEVRQKVIDVLSGYAGAPADAGSPASTGPPPTCPGCRIGLDGRMGAKALVATGDATGADLAVLVVYCRSCGRALGTFPSPPSPPS